MLKQTKKKVRKTALILGALGALGLGAYFGTRKSVEELTGAVNKIADGVAEMTKATQGQEYRRLHDMDVIDDAVRNGVKFVYYPGLGVRLNELKLKKAA